MYKRQVVTEVLPAAQLLDRTLAVTTAMLGNSWDAINNGRRLYELAADMEINQALAMGKAWGMATLDSPDSRAGIAAYGGGRQAEDSGS